MRSNEDSDRFSLYKKGDDPSEIFDIRDFKDGDRFQQIHWKLSSKTGHYMVKRRKPSAGKSGAYFHRPKCERCE